MTDRKIWKAVLCFAMSIVLAVPGCAANTPASESAQSDLQEAAQGGTGQEAAGQDSALQENTEQAAAGEEISEQKETSGDVFDFEEGDQSTPAAAGEMPSKFDLRDVEVKGSGIVPPVRFQNPFGTCWSFGATAAAEISILGSGLAQDDGYTAETFNLSEKHLAYFTYSSLDDPEDPQNGEGKHFSVKASGSQKMIGGRVGFATWLYSSGIGPNLEDREGLDEGDEEVLVYRGRNGETESRIVTWYDEDGEKHSGVRRMCYSKDDDWDIPEKYRFYQSYRLKDSNILPCPAQMQSEYGKEEIYTYNPRGTEAIKQQLLANRGVSISINAESSRPDQTTKKWKYLSSNWAQYTYESAFNNPHTVCIVGWDDDYPKENFIEGHQPPENGAWLCRNSWGSDYNDFPANGYRHWGIEQEENKHNGYFWVSYYDRTLSDPEAFVFDKSNVGSSYYVQQYDYVPAEGEMVKQVESDQEMKIANVFVADQNAKLTEISTVTTTPNSEVSYEIYLLRSRYRNPSDGVLIQSGEGYTFEYGGYHRFALKEPVQLFRKQAYSVVISQKTPSGKAVFGIVCGEKHTDEFKDIRDDDWMEAPEGNTGEFAAEEEPAGNTGEIAAEEEPAGNAGEVVMEEASEGNSGEIAPEEEEDPPADEDPVEWDECIVNRRESYLQADGKWMDLTGKEAYDFILGSGKKYAGEADTYDNLPIKAYLEDAGQEAYPEPAKDLEVSSLPGRNTKQVLFKLLGRVEEWDTDPAFTWTSSDTSIFTVETLDPEEGVMQITGISPGRACLTISSEEMGTRVVGVTVE